MSESPHFGLSSFHDDCARQSLLAIAQGVRQRTLGGHDGNVTVEVSNLEDIHLGGSFGTIEMGQWSCDAPLLSSKVVVKFPQFAGASLKEAGKFILINHPSS
jgi:hypothetical protein